MQIILKILIIYYVIGLVISLHYSMSPKYREEYIDKFTIFEIIAGILMAAIVAPATWVLAVIKNIIQKGGEEK